MRDSSNTKALFDRTNESVDFGRDTRTADFAEKVRVNQQRLMAELRPYYDFIVCGSGSSGSVVARRLAENPDVSVLLLEAGGTDDVPNVREAIQWSTNLGSERDWGFRDQPNPHLNGRSIALNMGKVLGGGSSVNVMAWSRGHKNDWDFFASEAGDPAWNYESVLNIYRRIEDWHGAPDPKYRGLGGPVYVQPAPISNPIFPAMLEAARAAGIPTFENPNGRMQEGQGGCSIQDIRSRDGKRQSIFRSYTFPYMDRPNLTVLTHATVIRVTVEGMQATGVEIAYNQQVQRIRGLEVVLSLGAINTPKILMQSGIGDEAELRRLGIPRVQHLPGVGRNLQDHFMIRSIWESEQPLTPSETANGAVSFWKSNSSLDTPDIQQLMAELTIPSAKTAARFTPPANSWTIAGVGVAPPEPRSASADGTQSARSHPDRGQHVVSPRRS
jgi:choline dehydrogenase